MSIKKGPPNIISAEELETLREEDKRSPEYDMALQPHEAFIQRLELIISKMAQNDRKENRRLLKELTGASEVLKEHLAELAITPKHKIRYKIKSETEENREQVIDTLDMIFSLGLIEIIVKGFFDKRNGYIALIKKEKEIAKREREVKRKEKGLGGGKFKKAGHLVDQTLKYDYPKENRGQGTLWDLLQLETKSALEIADIKREEIVEGIKLSPPETKVIDCLCKLLHERSQTTEPKKESYYSGNMEYEKVDMDVVGFNGNTETPAPKLAFTLYELTREYKGGDAVSGKDVENVKKILTDLDNKKFLLSYVETTMNKDGGKTEHKIEGFRKLIDIAKISRTDYNRENIELSKTEETIIVLNPIFRRQIDSKFVSYPNDINRRTIIAYGSHNLPEITIRLRDYLMREHSSKRYQPEISLDKLYYLLSEKWMKESRKKMVKDYTDKALETVTALGLLKGYEITTGSTGEPKIVFNLNKGWA